MKRRNSSRQRFREFREVYRAGRADQYAADLATQLSSDELPTAREKRRRYLRLYVHWLWPHRYMVATLALLALVTAALEMIQPLFMRYIIDRVLLAEGLDTGARYLRLNIAGAVFLGVVVLDKLAEASRNYRQRLLNVQVIMSLRKALFGRLLSLPLGELTDMKVGGILSRLSGDLDRTTGLLQLAIISPGVALVRLLIALGILFVLNWQLALTALAIIPPAMFISLMVASRIRPIYRAMRKEHAAIDARVSETFGGIRVVRAFRREVRELAEFLTGQHAIVRKELFAHRRELVLWTTWGFLLAAVNVVILWFGGYLQIASSASIGDIMAFQWYTLLLLNPVWQIVNSFSELQRSLAGMERVFEVLQLEPDKPDRPGAIDAPRQVESIHFDHVWFEYNPDKPVLRDFDVFVPGGCVVALVGRSGAGKTTVTDLVARFYDPTQGRILLNGLDLRDLRLTSYRDLLGIVQQEVFLFDGTIRDNIAYGRPRATEAAVIDAASRANAMEFIEQMPLGLDSMIGERGVRLSGGQAQRLSIARAILADPQILILDEATSNLDTASEQLIQQSLADLLHGRTTFVIAHRLSTVASADIILVMDEGQIVESGTHDELMAARGDYHAMVARQRAAIQEDVLL